MRYEPFGIYAILISGTPGASILGSLHSVMTHITGIQFASSQPDTSAHRPDTRKPSFATTALPDGRVELAKSRRASLKSSVLTLSERWRLKRPGSALFQAIQATEAS